MPHSLGLGIALWLLTALITWGWIKLAESRHIHDQPERRRLHSANIPRAGGVSIAIVMIPATSFIYLGYGYGNPIWLLIISATVLFSILGFWDDLKPIDSGRKLSLHLFVTTLIFLLCVFILSLGWIASVLVALAYLLTVNIWNFMDGSNGMVGMQSLLMVIGFISLSYFSKATYDYAFVLAICCLGFLPFNFPVARVFPGDVGSHVLGAAVFGLAILAYTENQWTLLEILCLFSVLWIDASLTFARRALRGFKVTQPHRSHLYQYAIRSGKTHAAVCCYYALWTIAIILLIGLGRQLPDLGQQILLVAVMALGAISHQVFRIFVLKSVRRPNFLKTET